MHDNFVKNNNFIQSLSNVTQINIIRPQNIETTSLGVAYLSAIQSGILKNTSQINNFSKTQRIFKPQISKNEIKFQVKKWRKILKMLIKVHV